MPRFFSSCKEILRWYPKTPSGYYFIKTGRDSLRKVYCEMEKVICGEKGWEKFYDLDLYKNQSRDCPEGFIKKKYPVDKDNMERFFCGKAIGANKCTKTYFPLQERRYYEICANVRGYQYGTPSAFKPYDMEYSKFYMDGIHFTYGKEKRQLWSYVCGAHRDYKENMTKLRELCPDVSPKYRWPVPYYLDNTYYCDSGLYNYNDEMDMKRFHYEHRLWEGIDCEYPDHSCRRGGQPWFYRKFPTYMEDYIEVSSCFIGKQADVKYDNLEIYLR